jgi:thioredoxin reductase
MDDLFDVAIVGGGPAGLSAALVLGRSRRRVVVCDHGKPRNYAAKAIHGYLGHDGISPAEFRQLGRKECETYALSFIDQKVVAASCQDIENRSMFQLKLQNGGLLQARKLLLGTGVEDRLPQIPRLNEFYGITVHHCPYCDGWEHRDKRLIAYGHGAPAAKLAVTLLAWSRDVTCCSDGSRLSSADMNTLRCHEVNVREERVVALVGNYGILEQVQFASGPPSPCDALFFSADQGQRSKLPQMLGCECNEDGLIDSTGKQGSGVRGLFLAGDADGDVQFAVVAAAEGAIAATAIHAELQEDGFF